MSRTYEIYEHVDESTSCREPGWSFTQEYAEKVLDEKDDEYDDPREHCLMCDGEMEHVKTEEVSETFPEPDKRLADLIDELDDHGRALFLGMAMTSLRGNWSTVTGRLTVIGAICDAGVGDQLSDDFLDAAESRARNQLVKRRATYEHNDGRTFRGQSDGCYGKLWDEVEKDVPLMRRLATHLPHDMTYDHHKFEKLENDE